MNAAANGIWQKNPSLAWREIDDETVIISPGESVMHELNDTASFVWRNIDGRRNAEDLAALLAEQYDVAREIALADILALLEGLSSRQLLVPVEPSQGGATR
jgi:Coenzyme PQQ synthesis protein D (PqqD)